MDQISSYSATDPSTVPAAITLLRRTYSGSHRTPPGLHTGMALSSDHPMSTTTPFGPFSASSEDDRSEDSAGVEMKKTGNSSPPWNRMKWTDDVVRLLISTVSCVDNDGSIDGGRAKQIKCDNGAMQKKGKWKTVSKLMLERGSIYVSPQQCEDKFNDLNKSYKRLNHILGGGAASRQVIENPALLESMQHVSAKAKEDIKKMLSSKHLYYREMCAYHNGQRMQDSHNEHGLPICDLHVTDGGDQKVVVTEEEEPRRLQFGEGCNIDDGLFVEMEGVVSDAKMTASKKKSVWFRNRALEVQEGSVQIQAEAFELEKKRRKWRRFCRRQDMELERMRVENERMGIENEQMVMQQLKEKDPELELKKKCGEFRFGGSS